MEVRDYNGEGKWSREQILRRYSQYCRQLKVLNPIDLSPDESVQGEVKWIFPVMHKVIIGIEQGDAACRRIGIEFIEEDCQFPFGKTLKSNTARALRRSLMSAQEQERVRRRIISMLVAGNVPHEYKEYAKLLKKVGVKHLWNEIESRVDQSNESVMKYYKYLKEA